MKTITSNYKAEDGKNYYDIVLNLENKEFIQIKNASCTACALDVACNYWNLSQGVYSAQKLKVFFMSTCVELNLKYIPKKYHKYFNKVV